VTLQDFRATLSSATPPGGLSPALLALWHDGRDDWTTAHAIAQDIDGATGAWVHAYLHRKEGDLSNARYWYRAASRPAATGSLADEWGAIVGSLLDDHGT
jgi:hypothetical protein